MPAHSKRLPGLLHSNFDDCLVLQCVQHAIMRLVCKCALACMSQQYRPGFASYVVSARCDTILNSCGIVRAANMHFVVTCVYHAGGAVALHLHLIAHVLRAAHLTLYLIPQSDHAHHDSL